MIGTGHLLIGGAIGAGTALVLPAPVAVPASLALGILSHHLLDFIPHTDAATFYPDPGRPPPRLAQALVGLEILTGLALTCFLLLVQHSKPAFLLGAAGGMLPDVCDEVPLWQERFRRTALGSCWHRWHLRLHCGCMARSWPAGLAIDILVIATGLWLLLP